MRPGHVHERERLAAERVRDTFGAVIHPHPDHVFAGTSAAGAPRRSIGRGAASSAVKSKSSNWIVWPIPTVRFCRVATSPRASHGEHDQGDPAADPGLDVSGALMEESSCLTAAVESSRPDPPRSRRPEFDCASRSRRGPGGPRRSSRSSVEVPAVRPTVAKPRNQAGSRLGGRLDVEHRPARARGSGSTSSRVLFELRPADDHDRLDPVEQPLERPLMLLGRQADRVDEPDLGVAGSARRSPRGSPRPCRSVAVVWQTIPSRSGGDTCGRRLADSMTSN